MTLVCPVPRRSPPKLMSPIRTSFPCSNREKDITPPPIYMQLLHELIKISACKEAIVEYRSEDMKADPILSDFLRRLYESVMKSVEEKKMMLDQWMKTYVEDTSNECYARYIVYGKLQNAALVFSDVPSSTALNAVDAYLIDAGKQSLNAMRRNAPEMDVGKWKEVLVWKVSDSMERLCKFAYLYRAAYPSEPAHGTKRKRIVPLEESMTMLNIEEDA